MTPICHRSELPEFDLVANSIVGDLKTECAVDCLDTEHAALDTRQRFTE
jgi:hypothetical protein